MTPSPILTVKQLTTRFHTSNKNWIVVDHLDFNLYKGKTLALVGESGCGKTLTALSLLRILPTPPAKTSTGEVIYQGENILTLSEKKMQTLRGCKIAMIFQDPMSALNPVYTIANQLMEVAFVHLGLTSAEAWQKAYQSLEAVGVTSIKERLQAYPHQLSGGLKQRVMIAMALMCEPDILIADEPTTALDVTIQAQVLDLIAHLQKKKEMALLLITHDMGVVAKMADEVIVMYAAQAVEKATVPDLFQFPTHPYTQGLLQSRPILRKQMTTRPKLTPIKGQVPPLDDLPTGCRFHPRCPYAMKKCINTPVPTFTVPSSNHLSRCLLYDGTIESQEKLYSFQQVKLYESPT